MIQHLQVLPLVGTATEADLVHLGRAMFLESRFAPLGFDFDKATAMAQRVLSEPGFISFGAYDRNRLEGFCIGELGPLHPFSSALVADEFLLYLSPKFRGDGSAKDLALHFIAEARRRGARDITFSNGTGFDPERVHQFYLNLGLTHIGGVYSFGA